LAANLFISGWADNKTAKEKTKNQKSFFYSDEAFIAT